MIICNCYSGYTDENDRTIHYADCAIIQFQLQQQQKDEEE